MKYSENFYPLFSLTELKNVLYPGGIRKQELLKGHSETLAWINSAAEDSLPSIPQGTKIPVLYIPDLTPETRTDSDDQWKNYTVRYIYQLRRRGVFLSVHFAGLLNLGANTSPAETSSTDLNNRISGLMRNGSSDIKKYVRKNLLIRLMAETGSLDWMIEKNTLLSKHCIYPWREISDYVQRAAESLRRQDTDTDKPAIPEPVIRDLYLPLLKEALSCFQEAGETGSANNRGKGLTLLLLTALLGANMYNLMPAFIDAWVPGQELEALKIWESEYIPMPAAGAETPADPSPVNVQEQKYTHDFIKNVSDIGLIGGSSLLILAKVGDIMNSEADPYTLEQASDIYYYGIIDNDKDNFRKAYLCSRRSYDLRKKADMPAGTSAFNLGYYYYMQVYGSPNDQKIIQSMNLPPENADPVQTSINYFAEAAFYGHPSAINSLGNHAQKLLQNQPPGESPSETDRLRLRSLRSLAYEFARSKGLHSYLSFRGLTEKDLTGSVRMTADLYQKICLFCEEVFYEKSASLFGLHGMNNYRQFLTKLLQQEFKTYAGDHNLISANQRFRSLSKELLKYLQTLANTCHYPRALTDYALCLIRRQNILMNYKEGLEGLEGFTGLIYELDLEYEKRKSGRNARPSNIFGIKRSYALAEKYLKIATSFTMPQFEVFYAFYSYALFLFYRGRLREAYHTADRAWELIRKEPVYENFRNTGKTSHEVMGDFLTILQLQCAAGAPEETGITAAKYLQREKPAKTISYFRSVLRNNDRTMSKYEQVFIEKLNRLHSGVLKPLKGPAAIPLVPRETENAKYWYDRLSAGQDSELATERQIQDLNNAAYGNISCHIHDILSYTSNCHDPELERPKVTEHWHGLYEKLQLGSSARKWKKSVKSNIDNARYLNGKDGFCWGIAKKSTAVQYLPEDHIPKSVLKVSKKTEDDLRIAELEEGELFIAFLLSPKGDYYWVHTVCTEGWVRVSDVEIDFFRDIWHTALTRKPKALTRENLLEVMFRNYGAPYKWGTGTDCSGYVRKVYQEFGLMLPLNTVWQQNYPARKYDLNGLPDDEKLEIIRSLPTGAALYMEHHAMLYLGEVNRHQYVISSLGSFYDLDHNLQVPSRITVSTLDLQREKGETWLTSLTSAMIPWEEAAAAAGRPG